MVSKEEKVHTLTKKDWTEQVQEKSGQLANANRAGHDEAAAKPEDERQRKLHHHEDTTHEGTACDCHLRFGRARQGRAGRGVAKAAGCQSDVEAP